MKTMSWLGVLGLAVCTAFAEEVKQDEPPIAVEVRFIEATGKNGLKGVDVFSDKKLPKHVNHLATLRVVAKSGQQVSNKIVTDECIYPKDYALRFSSGKPEPGYHQAIVEPLNFVMQEVGAFLDVTPTWNPKDNTIDLDFTPAIVEEPTWHAHVYVDEQGKKLRTEDGRGTIELPMERPHFPVLKVSTKLKLQDGVHAVFGGIQEVGAASPKGGFKRIPDKEKRTFYFVIKATVLPFEHLE